MSRIERIGECELYLGDCREILPTLGKVDAVVTDPPYGIGIAANPVRQRHERKAWDDAVPCGSVFALIRECSRWQIIWGGNYFDLPPSQGFLVWDKVQPQDFSLAMCEQAWTNVQAPAKIFRRHVVSFAKDHPTQKPRELMEWCLERLPEPNHTILDPFMGAGTTGVACANRGRRFIGIEMEPKYFDIACRRIEEAYKQPDMFVAAPPPKAEQLSFMALEGAA
jgi:site-specific DNA-methyltransferase (adenine-specific)